MTTNRGIFYLPTAHPSQEKMSLSCHNDILCKEKKNNALCFVVSLVVFQVSLYSSKSLISCLCKLQFT